MMTRPGVALASTLHDPEGADLPNLLEALPAIARRYAGMAIFATEDRQSDVSGAVIQDRRSKLPCYTG